MEDEAQELLGTSLVKQLASCKQSIRDKAIRRIFTAWLPFRTEPLADGEMKRLWKGLFYCFWHADKVPYQSLLVQRLCSPLVSLPLPVSRQYFSVFLLTMRREWTGIDRLRLDKFYLLIRRFLHGFFGLLRKNSWDLGLTREMMGLFQAETFLADNMVSGNGVNYHIATVFLEELRPFLPLRPEVLEAVLKPFALSMGKVRDRILVEKIRSGVFDVLLKTASRLLQIRKAGEDAASEEDAVVFGPIGLKMGFADLFYELGSSDQCCQGNRKVLLGLHVAFLKLEKDLASSGLEIPMPAFGNVSDESNGGKEVTNSVSLDTHMGEGENAGGLNLNEREASGDKIMKKKEKEKDKKKRKKKKKKIAAPDLIISDSSADVEMDSVNSNDAQTSDGSSLTFSEILLSNLQMQFEQVAAEAGLDSEVASPCEFSEVKANGAVSKKRKRTKSVEGKQFKNEQRSGHGDAEGGMSAKSEERSTKKVSFSMKNNIVWKPHNPLPPQSLRLPPSVTPRGSALKKGVPPGPIRETPPSSKKVKRKVASLKMGRKAIKSISPATKRLKKLRTP